MLRPARPPLVQEILARRKSYRPDRSASASTRTECTATRPHRGRWTKAGAAAPRRPSALLRQDLSTAGLIEKARAEARRTLTALAGDAPVVGLEPSCLMTLRDEFVSQFRRWRLFARCKKAVGIRPAGLRSGALGDGDSAVKPESRHYLVFPLIELKQSVGRAATVGGDARNSASFQVALIPELQDRSCRAGFDSTDSVDGRTWHLRAGAAACAQQTAGADVDRSFPIATVDVAVWVTDQLTDVDRSKGGSNRASFRRGWDGRSCGRRRH